MPILKAISGHGSTGGIRRYLEKGDRALGRDLLNLPVDEWISEDRGCFAVPIEWDREMDATREAYETNSSWRGQRARTFKHFVISPDPNDSISFDALRELSQAWAFKYFGDHEIAIVYHDDNDRGIPHAHIVVNNVNLRSGYRMHTDHPEDLNRDLQDMARERGLTGLSNDMPKERGAAKKKDPRSRQAVYFGRAEKELMRSGNYSWVGDIRARVALAKNTSRTESEFMEALAKLGIEVSDNSEKARRDDWIFSLADTPSKKVSGERLGFTYGKEMLQRRFERQGSYVPEKQSASQIRTRASRAVELNDLNDLSRLSSVLETCAKFDIRCIRDFDRRLDALRRRGSEQSEGFRRLLVAKGYVASNKLMPVSATPGQNEAKATRRRGAVAQQPQTRMQEIERIRNRERGER